MRIAVASVLLGQVFRGVETWAHDLATELYRRQYDVVLFQGGGRGTLPYERSVFCSDHMARHWSWITKVTRHGGWRFGLSTPESVQHTTFALNLIVKLRRGHFDVVHIQDAWAGYLLEKARRHGLHSAKVILGHGTNESFEFLTRFEHVQELSPYHLELDRQKGLPASKLWFAIPNFVDGAMFCPGPKAPAQMRFGLPADRFVVLEIAVLKPHHKRIEWLVQEVLTARKSNPKIFLFLVGARNAETPLIEKFVSEQLGGSVKVLTDVGRADMPDIYRAADLIGHPILQERMPIALLEALATGIPIIGHTYPIQQWVIGPGGATVDMERPGELAASLVEFSTNTDRHTQAATAARQHALANFEKSQVVDQIVAMYEKVLAAA